MLPEKQKVLESIMERRQRWVEDVQALFEDGLISYESYCRIDTFLMNFTADAVLALQAIEACHFATAVTS